MALVTAIIIIAIGALLRFALSGRVLGLSVHAIGDVLMVIGAIGLVASTVFLVRSARRMPRDGPPPPPAN